MKFCSGLRTLATMLLVNLLMFFLTIILLVFTLELISVFVQTASNRHQCTTVQSEFARELKNLVEWIYYCRLALS